MLLFSTNIKKTAVTFLFTLKISLLFHSFLLYLLFIYFVLGRWENKKKNKKEKSLTYLSFAICSARFHASEKEKCPGIFRSTRVRVCFWLSKSLCIYTTLFSPQSLTLHTLTRFSLFLWDLLHRRKWSKLT